MKLFSPMIRKIGLYSICAIAGSLISFLAVFICRGGYSSYISVSYFIVLYVATIYTYFYFKLKIALSKYLQLLLLNIPLIFVTFYSLHANRDLYPIAFPAITIVVFIGIISAFIFIYKSKKTAIFLLAFGTIGICIWNSIFLVPIISKQLNRYTESSIRLKFENLFLKNQDGESIKVETLIGNKPSLLDFMFFDCKPCKKKLPFLNTLAGELKEKSNILVIVNGNIDSFEYYKKLCENYAFLENLIFYYDDKGLFTTRLKVDAYPKEFIIDKQAYIKFTSSGFDPILENSYVNERKKIIHKLLL